MKTLLLAFVLCASLSFVLAKPYDDALENLESLIKREQEKAEELSLYERLAQALGLEKRCIQKPRKCEETSQCCSPHKCVTQCDEGGCLPYKQCGPNNGIWKK